MPEQGLLQLESESDGEPKSRNCPGLRLKSSSIISEANRSSSDIQLSPEFSGCSCCNDAFSPNWTFRTQFDSGWRPLFFCQIPRFDCSASRHRQVRDCVMRESFFPGCTPSCCEAKYQRWSFALRVADSIWVFGPCGLLGSRGKFVRARAPHMSRAASSYAWAASSAVSKVPNQTLVFLKAIIPWQKVSNLGSLSTYVISIRASLETIVWGEMVLESKENLFLDWPDGAPDLQVGPRRQCGWKTWF